MRRIRRHLTYANVISTLCLFLVLGGGTAVALDGSNTVFSDDIVDGQVKAQDLARTPVGAVFARIKGLGPSGTTFGTVSGTSSADSNEGEMTTITPSPQAPIVASGLAVKLTVAPNVNCAQAPNCSRRFTLRDDGADTPVACTITGAQTACNSGTATATIASGSKLSIKSTIPLGSPNNGANALIGWRAGTP
jgi:hypothetical protein